MIAIEPHAEGVVLPVRAQPGSRANGLRGEHRGALKVSVTQVAEKGKANQAIVELLAKTLAVRRSQIELVSGQTSPQKKFLIRGITVEQLRERLSAAPTAK
ncbi:MAG: DUF167 domain-containing protein [Pirellulales bacterium]